MADGHSISSRNRGNKADVLDQADHRQLSSATCSTASTSSFKDPAGGQDIHGIQQEPARVGSTAPAPAQQAESNPAAEANQAGVQAQARRQPRHRIRPLILYFFTVAGLIFFCLSFLTWTNNCSTSISQLNSIQEQPVPILEPEIKMATEQTYVNRTNPIDLVHESND